jgi:hypothetical protein
VRKTSDIASGLQESARLPYKARGHAEMSIRFRTRAATLEPMFPQQFKYIHYANGLQQDRAYWYIARADNFTLIFNDPYIYTQYNAGKVFNKTYGNSQPNIPFSQKTILSACGLLYSQMSCSLVARRSTVDVACYQGSMESLRFIFRQQFIVRMNCYKRFVQPIKVQKLWHRQDKNPLLQQ